MSNIPIRTSADTNASGDIGLLAKGLPFWNTNRIYDENEFLNDGNGVIYKSLQDDNQGHTPASSPLWWEEFSGGSKADFIADFPAGSWEYPATDLAYWDTTTGTNNRIRAQLFGDGSADNIDSSFYIPPDPDTTGTVTFYVYGFSVTAASSKRIAMYLNHSAKEGDEDWDTAMDNEYSGDLLVSDTQNDIDILSWTATFSSLGWAALDQVIINLLRTAPSGSELSGDYAMTNFRIRIPRD